MSSRLFLPEKPSHEDIQYDHSPQWQAAAHAINAVLCRPRTREGPRNCTKSGKEWMPSAQGWGLPWDAIDSSVSMIIALAVFTFGSTGTY